MAGGLVGYLGYDMVRLMENLPAKNRDEIGVPDALLLRPTLFAIFDNVNDELTLAAPIYPQADIAAEAAWEAAQARLTSAEAALERPLPHPAPPVMLPDMPTPASTFSKEEFMAAVERCKDYIAAGDAFQIVLRPAVLRAVRAAALRAVSRAAADQSRAVPVLFGFRRLRRGGVVARRCWCGCVTAQ